MRCFRPQVGWISRGVTPHYKAEVTWSFIPYATTSTAHLAPQSTRSVGPIGRDQKARGAAMKAPLPSNERRRLTALHTLDLLDTAPDERFDRICRIARDTFHVPIA